MEEELDGCFCEAADKIPRKDETWSDTNLHENEYWPWKEFTRLKCRNCGGLSFEVLSTGDYETSAKCDKCGMYYIVHCG